MIKAAIQSGAAQQVGQRMGSGLADGVAIGGKYPLRNEN